MPELPEVETTKTSLKPVLRKQVSRVEVFQPKLRWPVPENLNALQGYTLESIRRRAKYLILEFSGLNEYSELQVAVSDKTTSKPQLTKNNKAIIIHLGMSGSLQQFPLGTAKRKHDHLIIQFSTKHSDTTDSDAIQLHYHDPRRFGAVLWYEDYADKLFNHLGVEPLDKEFNGAYLYHQIHRSYQQSEHIGNTRTPKPITRPIKAVIMDQAFVVGVGNIYATESLFLSNIHPTMPANTLSQDQLKTLADHIRAILKRAIKQGGSTLRDFTVASGTTGYFQQTLNVYGKYKEPCPTCNTPIEKVVITGRSSTYCPVCQPL